jgi:hypothetical protein
MAAVLTSGASAFVSAITLQERHRVLLAAEHGSLHACRGYGDSGG